MSALISSTETRKPISELRHARQVIASDSELIHDFTGFAQLYFEQTVLCLQWALLAHIIICSELGINFGGPADKNIIL